MKQFLIYGSMLLVFTAQVTTQAQPQLAPSLQLPKARSQTPTLDAFANAGQTLPLRVRWVRIDSAKLPANLPAWNKGGAWSHVATPEELKRLELLKQTGIASVNEQQLRATNNQTLALSFAPLAFVESLSEKSLSKSGPIDEMIIPRVESRFVPPPPYIPNLARPKSRLPEMAPMPGAGGKLDPPFIAPIPVPDPAKNERVRRVLPELMRYKFQLHPTISGDQIALDLRSLNSADNIAATSRAKLGETVVFSLPNMIEFLGSNEVRGNIIRFQTRRTFLLVTPRLALDSRRPNQ